MGKSGTMQPVRSRLTYNILSLPSTVHQNGRPYGFHVTVTSYENALDMDCYECEARVTMNAKGDKRVLSFRSSFVAMVIRVLSYKRGI